MEGKLLKISVSHRGSLKNIYEVKSDKTKCQHSSKLGEECGPNILAFTKMPTKPAGIESEEDEHETYYMTTS